MQQPMYLPNGYMMTYYPQVPLGNMAMYGMENGAQGEIAALPAAMPQHTRHRSFSPRQLNASVPQHCSVYANA